MKRVWFPGTHPVLGQLELKERRRFNRVGRILETYQEKPLRICCKTELESLNECGSSTKTSSGWMQTMTQGLTHRPVWTYADYCILPQDYNRHEIIEGDHIVTPSPTSRHQRVLGNLFSILNFHVRPRKLGTVIAAPMDVLLADTSVVQPDLLFIRKEREEIITEPNIQGPPDLVVEVLSVSTAAIDRGLKMRLYVKYGVPRYWILDARRLSLEMYEIIEGDCELISQFGKGETAESPLFPGLLIPISELGE
jgi:Uma2 family endonuclease